MLHVVPNGALLSTLSCVVFVSILGFRSCWHLLTLASNGRSEVPNAVGGNPNPLAYSHSMLVWTMISMTAMSANLEEYPPQTNPSEAVQ